MDVHVGKFMMTETLLKYCKDKTRVLVTHALYYLKYVDKVLIMEDGRVVEQGSYEKLKNSARFREIYSAMMKDEKRKRSGSVDLLEDVENMEEKIEEEEEKKEEPVEKQEEEAPEKTVRSQSHKSHLQEKANKE